MNYIQDIIKATAYAIIELVAMAAFIVFACVVLGIYTGIIQ